MARPRKAGFRGCFLPVFKPAEHSGCHQANCGRVEREILNCVLRALGFPGCAVGEGSRAFRGSAEISEVNLGRMRIRPYVFYGEFDSGSERTLAAWIRHASCAGVER